MAIDVHAVRSRRRSQSVRRILLPAGVMVILWFALSPHPPHIFAWNKIQHGTAFIALTVAFRGAYPALRLRWAALFLSGFGGAIKVFQGIPAVHRDSSIFDWYADIIAILFSIGLIVLLITVKQLAHACCYVPK